MNEISKSEASSKIWNLIRDTRIAMLTTQSSEGLRSRPMATQESEFNGELWFLSRQESGKVNEIEHGSSVNLTYVNSEAHTYVSLSGRAELSKDRAKIHELWRPMHAAWFPQGKDDPEIMAIKVTVQDAEYWDAPNNALIRTYRLMKAAATGGESKVGEHEKVSLS
jgi:general stress protein 26